MAQFYSPSPRAPAPSPPQKLATWGVRHFPSPSAAPSELPEKTRRCPSPGDERVVLSAPRRLGRLSAPVEVRAGDAQPAAAAD